MAIAMTMCRRCYGDGDVTAAALAAAEAMAAAAMIAMLTRRRRQRQGRDGDGDGDGDGDAPPHRLSLFISASSSPLRNHHRRRHAPCVQVVLVPARPNHHLTMFPAATVHVLRPPLLLQIPFQAVPGRVLPPLTCLQISMILLPLLRLLEIQIQAVHAGLRLLLDVFLISFLMCPRPYPFFPLIS